MGLPKFGSSQISICQINFILDLNFCQPTSTDQNQPEIQGLFQELYYNSVLQCTSPKAQQPPSLSTGLQHSSCPHFLEIQIESEQYACFVQCMIYTGLSISVKFLFKQVKILFLLLLFLQQNCAESMFLVYFLINIPSYHAFKSLVFKKFVQITFQQSKSDYQKILAKSSRNCSCKGPELLSNLKLQSYTLIQNSLTFSIAYCERICGRVFSDSILVPVL